MSPKLLAVALVLPFLACGPDARPDPGLGSGTASMAASSSGSGLDTLGDADETTIGTGTHPDPTDPPASACANHKEVLEDAWVNIDGGDDDERGKLDGVAFIEGNLVIDGTEATDLDFLECIVEVTGSLYVHDNDALVDVSGLDRLEVIGGDLVIANNDALVELAGLNALERLRQMPPTRERPMVRKGSLVVSGNPALQAISGLTNLLLVAGSMSLRDNPSLTDVSGLEHLVAVGESVSVVHNASLCASEIESWVEGFNPEPARLSVTANDEGC